MSQVFERRLMLDCFPLLEKRQVLVRITDTGMLVSDKLKALLLNEVFSELVASQAEAGIIEIAKRVRQAGGLLAVDAHYQKGSRFLLYLPLLTKSSSSTALNKAYSKGKYQFLEGGLS
jgi:sensor histidine kinase regulating citrate/malate metabolism